MARDPLSDGFVSICIDPSANWFGEGTRVLVEGQALGSVFVPDVIVPVTGTRGLETTFGQGSILTESLKTIFKQAPSGISVYALPRADAGAAVDAAYTLTITGPATSDGRFTLYSGNSDYNIDFRVEAGDTAVAIAAALVAEVNPNFPFSAAVGTTPGTDDHIVTFTAKNGGTIGNNLNFIYNWAERANYAPACVSVAFAQTVTGATDPAPADYASIIGDCHYDVYILQFRSLALQENLRDWIRDAWDCSKPQSFGHGYVFNQGSVGQVLATGDNSAELSRLAVPTDEPAFPWLINAAYGALSGATANTNPELSIQGPTNGLLSAVSKPQVCSTGWPWDDSQQLRENGFVVYGPATINTGGLTNPFIYNDVTNYLYDDLMRPNATFRDTNSRRLATQTAIQLAEKVQEFNGLALYTKNTNIPQRVRGTNPTLILANIQAWAQSNVGTLFSEFEDINEDIQLQTDFQVQPPCVGKPGVLHLFMRYRPPVRIDKINAVLRPELLDNCVR